MLFQDTVGMTIETTSPIYNYMPDDNDYARRIIAVIILMRYLCVHPRIALQTHAANS